MTGTFLLAYAALWVTLLRALLERAQLVSRSCSSCGRPFERSRLGERVCGCHS